MKKVIEAINRLKDIGLIKDYAIGGAIAALRWVEPFFTRDLDVFIIPEKEVGEKELIILSPIYEHLKNEGYTWEGQWIIIEGIPVDIFPVDLLEKEAVEDAKETEYEGVKTKIIAPEYLIALFLRANRDKDMRKTQMLLEQAEIDMEKLNKVLNEHGLTEKFVSSRGKYYGK